MGQHDTFFPRSYRRITFFLIPHLDCTLLRLRSIGRPVHSGRSRATPGNVSNEIEQKEIRTGEKEREQKQRRREIRRNNVRGGVQILRHCVPRLSHICFTHISFSPPILQGITKGSYRSANPRGIVSYGRAVISPLFDVSFQRRMEVADARFGRKNSVARLTRRL